LIDMPGVSFQSRLDAVDQNAGLLCNEPIPISKLLRTRACGLDRQRPHGVTQRFQITSHKSEPARSCRKLFAKDRCRSSLRETLLHQGMIIVGLPYAFAGLTNMNEITGGTPYGASTLANADGSRQPSANELDGARYQGKHVAQITAKLTNNNH
jgi:hypothetical protein